MLLTNPIPSTVRKTPIRTRLGSARPTIDVPIAKPEPRCTWPRITPSRQRDQERQPERRPRELELLHRLRQQEARVVADEPDRIDERAGVELVEEDHSVLCDQGASAAAEADQRRVAGEREPDRESAGGVDLGLERVRLGEREEDRVAEPVRASRNAAIVAIEIVETTAIRSPLMIVGTASGSSTRVSIWRRVRPIPSAASSTSGGAERRPATMFGNRITSV